MQTRTSVLLWPAGIMAASLLAIIVALVAQHAFDVQPCPWCVLQRLLFLAIAVVSAIGLSSRTLRYRNPVGALVLLVALAGIASAAWQHFVAARSASCNLTLADKIIRQNLHLDRLLPSVFDARGSCADAAVNLLGIPFDFWSLGLFAVIGLAAIQYMRQPLRT
jgi:protein dithiol:quinone oxidoreductase